MSRGDRRRCRCVWRRNAALIIGAVVLVSSCSPGETLLLASDTYFASAFLDTTRRERLEDVADELRVRYSLRILPPDTPADQLIEMLNASDAAFVITTPFFAGLAAAAAPVFRDRRFIVLYGGALAAQENIQRIATDRSSAYADAGAFVARLSRYLAVTSGEPARVFVVAYTGDERRVRELETFLAGYGGQRSAGVEGLEESGGISDEARAIPLLDPSVKRFGSLAEGRVVAREMTDALDEYDIFVVSTGSMNAEALSVVDGAETAYVVTERFGGPLPAENRIVAVVEEDWVAAIGLAVDSRNPRVVIPSDLRPGPAQQRLGIPAALFE